jgi:uncharacterized protein YndB with AHSA1/START domain
MRIHEEFSVARPPDEVFAFMVEPANLARWQTVKTFVTPLDDGPPRLGYRVREGTKVGPREWEQVVEFTAFEPGRVFGVRVIEGPASSGRWTFEPDGGATRVRFEAEFGAPRMLAPVIRPVMARQFRGYHRNLRAELEAEGAPATPPR